MNKQRKIILIAAATGLLSLFLPFVSFGGLISITAIEYGGLAYLILLSFIAAVFVCIKGDTAFPLDNIGWGIALAGGCLAIIILLINLMLLIDFIRFIGIGFYLAIVSSALIIYFTLGYNSGTDIITEENNIEEVSDKSASEQTNNL